MAAKGSGRLDCHILGAGTGESIILRFPNGGWGLVDCFTYKRNGLVVNPVLDFLEHNKIKALEFVCLTHPHEDRYSGMLSVLRSRKVKVRVLWLFPELTAEQLTRIVRYSAESGTEEEATELADLLDWILEHIDERRKNRQEYELLQGVNQCYPSIKLPGGKPGGDESQIWSLAPSGNEVLKYRRKLKRLFDANYQLKSYSTHREHNQISVGLLICYGSTRIILGGDVEKGNWDDALKHIEPSALGCHLVKASHHGSASGYTDDSWTAFTARGKPCTVLTTYARGSAPCLRGQWLSDLTKSRAA